MRMVMNYILRLEKVPQKKQSYFNAGMIYSHFPSDDVN